jgi:PKD repeat protein
MNICKSVCFIIFVFIYSIIIIPAVVSAQDGTPKKIIYETDMCADVDDAGGLAILHAMANNGEAEVLAVCFNEVHPDGAAAIDAMNTWYGRGDIPVGVYKGNLSNPHGSNYLDHVAEFPHDLTQESAPSALDVYRQVLAEQPDSSVTIISVGFTNNINDLLLAEPDLVAQKVKELVQMAGVNNDGFNLVQHNLVSVSQNVIENWPTPLVISQEGSNIYTGDNYQYASEDNPYREAFYRYFGGDFGGDGRSSWDEMAVLYGVRGLSTLFREITSGTGSLTNGYVWEMEPGFRSYLDNKYAPSYYEGIIEDLMDQLPLGAHFTSSGIAGWLPFTVEFDASIATVGGQRSIEEYKWDFGGETTGEGQTVNHQYITLGTFDVQLTVIDNLGDSLQSSETIQVNDPIFSPTNYFGDIRNYLQNQKDLWSTEWDTSNLRLYLNNDKRDENLSMPGFSILDDSIYSDFTLSIETRTGENIAQNNLADYAIIFGYENDDNFNYIQMKTSSARVVNVSDGVERETGRTTKDAITDEDFHEIIVNLSGEQLTVTIDDSSFMSKTNTRYLKTGKIGFGSTKSAMYFDDVLITGSGSAASINDSEHSLLQFKLLQNFPNPFNPKTIINYELPITNYVELNIYNLIGQTVAILVNEQKMAGYHQVEWNAENLPSGVYYYVLKSGEFQDVKKMILLK